MTSPQEPQFHIIPAPAPKVQLHRLKNIVTYEVMASDLDRLEDAAGEEKNAATFCTAALGVFAGGALGLPTGDVSNLRLLAHLAVTIVAFVATTWFGVIWRRKYVSHQKISAEIRRQVFGADDTRTN